MNRFHEVTMFLAGEYQHLLVPDSHATFHSLITFLTKFRSSSDDVQQSSECLRYLSEVTVSIRYSNTHSLLDSGVALVLREAILAILANQNLSKCSISDKEGKSWGVCRLYFWKQNAGWVRLVVPAVSSNAAERGLETQRQDHNFLSLFYKICAGLKSSAKHEKGTSGIFILFLGHVRYQIFQFLRLKRTFQIEKRVSN